MNRTYYRETFVAGVCYRVGFAEDGYPVVVHRLRIGAPGRKPGLVRIEVTGSEGVAAIKQITGGTMRWYPPKPRWGRSWQRDRWTNSVLKVQG